MNPMKCAFFRRCICMLSVKMSVDPLKNTESRLDYTSCIHDRALGNLLHTFQVLFHNTGIPGFFAAFSETDLCGSWMAISTPQRMQSHLRAVFTALLLHEGWVPQASSISIFVIPSWARTHPACTRCINELCGACRRTESHSLHPSHSPNQSPGIWHGCSNFFLPTLVVFPDSCACGPLCQSIW